MRGLRLWLPVVALLALTGAAIGGAAIAVASHQHTDPVTANFTLARASGTERTCTGDDGQYRSANEVFAGAVTGDARLSGTAGLYLGSETNTTSGRGTFRGLLVVTDPTTQRVKLQAALSGVTTNHVQMHGLIQGLARDAGTLHGGQLVANFQAYSATGAIVGLMGGSGDNVEPAVIQQGGCPRTPPPPPPPPPPKR